MDLSLQTSAEREENGRGYGVKAAWSESEVLIL